MKRRVFTTLSGALALLLLVGCGGDPPTTELNAAKQVLDEARAAGAERFAPSELSAAQVAYSSAENEMNTQQEKLFKNFDQARQLIAEAQRQAEAARSATMTAKQRARTAAEGAIAEASSVLQRARTSLNQAPAGKGTEGDIEQLRTSLNGADADLNAARQALTTENFDIASTRSVSARQTAEQVEGGVQAAVERYNELVEKSKPWYERI